MPLVKLTKVPQRHTHARSKCVPHAFVADDLEHDLMGNARRAELTQAELAVIERKLSIWGPCRTAQPSWAASSMF